MRRLLKFMGIAFGIGALLIAGYLTGKVIHARENTRDLVEARLAVAREQGIALSPQRIETLVRIEDPTFWTNAGYDFETPGAGATTLTQGLAKRLYFASFTPGYRKIELIAIAAFALTPLASKDEIMTAVLSTAYFGEHGGKPVIGFAEGAKAWFGVTLNELSDDDFLRLVAMMPAPNHSIRLRTVRRSRSGLAASSACSAVLVRRAAGLT